MYAEQSFNFEICLPCNTLDLVLLSTVLSEPNGGIFQRSALCICCLCPYAFLCCGDAIQANLFICSLICQTRSNSLVTFYLDYFSHCLHPSRHTDFFAQTDTQAHRHTAFYLSNIYKAVCTPLPAKTQHALLIKSMNFMLQPLRHLTIRQKGCTVPF